MQAKACTLNSSIQFAAFALEQFYQIIDVPALRKEAVDIRSQRAPPFEHSSRYPRLAALLDLLLKSLLKAILFTAVDFRDSLRQKFETTNSGFNLADSLEAG
jgi:hypothetical protein